MNVVRHTFMSHAHQDAPLVNALTAALEAEGMRCWVAPRDIPLGGSWDDEIIAALDDSSNFFLVFSRHAVASRQVAKELTLADARNLPVHPIRIDQTVPSGSFEYQLAKRQWLDVSSVSDTTAMVSMVMLALKSSAAERHQPVLDSADDMYPDPDSWGLSSSMRKFFRRSR